MEFSILLSLYYKESPLALDQCFLSIWQEQSIHPNEIILVLDGPIGQDLSQCVQKWQEIIGKPLSVIPLSQNVGLGKALNKGLENCSNEWVFRMDTDDICKPDRFEKQIQFIEQNPEVVLFSSQIIEFKDTPNDGNIVKAVPVLHDDILHYAKQRSPFNHMVVAYKKSIIELVGGYQHHLFMEDYNLWLRVIGSGYKVGNHPEILLHARVGNGMHARRKGIEYIKSEKQLLDLKIKLNLQNPISAYSLFLIRSAFRLLPASILGKFYNAFLRKKIE